MDDEATPTLTTERLRLEPVGLEHAPSLQLHFADWAVIGKLLATVPWPYPDDGVKRFLVDDLLPLVQSGRAMAWALVLRETGEPIGLLEWRCAKDQRDHRGFWLAAAHHGKGGFLTSSSPIAAPPFKTVPECRLRFKSMRSLRRLSI